MHMAKRRSSKRGNKIEPSVMTLSFELSPSSFQNAVTDYIDLSQVASLVNRRFYRQGINWAVAGIKVLNAGGFQGSMVIQKLPNTWVMSNAWEKGFRAWQKMNREAMEEVASIRPKFMDFKIFADSDHHAAGVGANLLPVNYAAGLASINTATPGEWDYSTFEIPLSDANPANSVTRDVIAVGANYPGPGASGNFAVSLIEGYAASRALPDIRDPNMPDDASDASGSVAENWQSALFNEGTTQDSEVIQDLETQNNQAPYPFENDGIHLDTMYPNGANQLSGLEIHDVEFVTGTTIGGTTRFKGGNFPCGLIAISNYQTSEGGPFPTIIQIDLIPGNHRGYLCEPMTDM
ncbi:MAG: putative capsid protein [Cressdnaviricota sp.]|nr:MAG: putative capsid protein [Cressdnaviricota sp.]